MTKATSNNLIDVVMALVLIVIIGAIGISIADTTVTETALQPEDVAATNTLTFTGNFTDGDTFTINSVTFELDSANDGVTPGNIAVDTFGDNSSSAAIMALNQAFNTNEETSLFVSSAVLP